MENKSNVKRFLIIFILAFGTTAMYSLPYMKSSFYDPMQQALSLSHTQIGNLLSLYGLVGMVSYFIGGWFADRFSVRKLITFSLIASGALGFYFSTFPSYSMILLIFVLWGFTTILTFSQHLLRLLECKEVSQSKEEYLVFMKDYQVYQVH